MSIIGTVDLLGIVSRTRTSWHVQERGPVEIVNVIAWRRPDFLHATLIRLAIADEPHLHYRINIDHEPDERIYPAITEFAGKIGGTRVELIERGPHHNQGPTRNIVHALHESMAYDADFVHTIEDDIFIAADYFAYMRSAHELYPRAFCATAYTPQPKADFTEADHGAAFLKPYAPTVAVSYRRAQLERILKWMTLDYPEDMVAYNAKTFPGHPCGPAEWAGIDGTLGRVRRKLNGQTVYPVVNRAYHAGYIYAPCAGEACGHDTTRDGINNGPHRHGTELTGTIEERARKLLSMRADELNALSEEVTRDYTWADLDAHYGPVTRLIR
jgi:hypothetical protein